MERSGVLPPIHFAYQKSLGTCDALLCVSHSLQSALECGQEAQIVQIDFSAAFDRVNHLCILYKLCSVGMVVEVNLLSCIRSAAGQCFGLIIAPPVHFGAFFYFGK